MDVEIAKIFEGVQKNDSNNFERYFPELKSLHKKNSQEFFSIIFVNYLPHAIKVDKQEIAVDRLCSFITKIAVSFKGSPDYVPYAVLLNHLVQFSENSEKFVRFRSCTMIAKILSELPSETEIAEELMESITEAMIKRTMDKIQFVRIAAISSLEKIQTQSEDDAVTAEYIRLLRADPSKEVRCAVLKSMKIHKYTIDALLERLRDVDRSVREQALERIGTVELKYLKLRHRIICVDTGLKDRDPIVKAKCLSMCQKWLSSRNNSLCELLKFFKVSENIETATSLIKELVLDADYQEFTIVQETELKSELITPEFCLCWRLLSEHFDKSEDNSMIEKIVPDVPHFHNIVIDCVEKNKEFEVTQLLLMSGIVEKYTDDAGQKMLLGLLREMIRNSTYIVPAIPHIMDVLQKSHSERDFIRVVLEKIHCMFELLELNPDISIGENETVEEILLCLKEKQEELAKRSMQDDFGDVELEEAQNEMSVLEYKLLRLSMTSEKEEAILIGGLIIFEELLKRTSTRTDETLEGMLSILKRAYNSRFPTYLLALKNHAFSFLQCTFEKVRAKTITCLALYALEDDEPSFYVNVFRSALLMDPSSKVRESAIQGLFDMFLVFGPNNKEFIEQQEEENTQSISEVILDILYQQIANEELNIKKIVVEGFIKLAYTNNFVNVKILGSLLFALFNPATIEEDPNLFQCLSLFFPSYSFHSIEHQELVVHAFSEATCLIFAASKDSVLSLFDLQKFVESMLYLTDPENCTKKMEGEVEKKSIAHNLLAIALCLEIISAPTTKGAKILCKTMASLKIDYSDKLSVAKITHLAKQIAERLESGKDKVSIKGIQKFQEILALKTDKENPVELEEEQEEELKRQLEEYIQKKIVMREEMCDQQEQPVKAKKGRKKRASEQESNEEEPKSQIKRGKKAKISTESDDSLRSSQEIGSTETDNSSLLNEEKLSTAKPKRVPAKTSRKPVASRAKIENQEEDENTTVTKKVVKRGNIKTASVTKKSSSKKLEYSDSDSSSIEDSEDSSSSSSENEPVTPVVTLRPKRAAVVKTMRESSSSSSSFSSSSESSESADNENATENKPSSSDSSESASSSESSEGYSESESESDSESDDDYVRKKKKGAAPISKKTTKAPVRKIPANEEKKTNNQTEKPKVASKELLSNTKKQQIAENGEETKPIKKDVSSIRSPKVEVKPTTIKIDSEKLDLDELISDDSSDEDDIFISKKAAPENKRANLPTKTPMRVVQAQLAKLESEIDELCEDDSGSGIFQETPCVKSKTIPPTNQQQIKKATVTPPNQRPIVKQTEKSKQMKEYRASPKSDNNSNINTKVSPPTKTQKSVASTTPPLKSSQPATTMRKKEGNEIFGDENTDSAKKTQLHSRTSPPQKQATKSSTQPKPVSKVLPTSASKYSMPSTVSKNPKQAQPKQFVAATPLRVVNEQVAKLESEIDDLLS